MLLSEFSTDGTLSKESIKRIISAISQGIEKKMWDCDIKKTKEFYKKKLDFMKESDKPADTIPDYYYWTGYNYYSSPSYHDHNHDNYYYRNYFRTSSQTTTNLEKAIPDSNTGLSQINNSSLCYDGVNLQNACHDACHSACHDACHSACHDACHSACHSACHGACHSACVSSGH
jgi:hypothetical protein